MSENEYQAVRVHVVADSTRQPEAPRAPRRVTARYRTVVLTAAQPVAVVAGTEPYRHRLIVRATGNDVYLTDSGQAAQQAVSAGTGGGSDTAYLLPHTDTAPTPYESTEAVYAAAIAYPAVLSVIIESCEVP